MSLTESRVGRKGKDNSTTAKLSSNCQSPISDKYASNGPAGVVKVNAVIDEDHLTFTRFFVMNNRKC